ncbi:MAG: DNA adenine methylase [Rubrobacteraceae bacterium]
MEQLPLFEDNQRIINVASVPQRSPFRYPGGKTWLVPRIRRWLSGKNPRPGGLVEPFAGGGIVGLTAAFEGLAERVVMVELDEQLAAVWRVIIEESGGAEWLSEKIVTFELSLPAVREVLNSSPASVYETAFFTILKNRVNRGGILAPGASLVKAGENGRGISSRWYPETLKKRILDIAGIRERITFIHGDGLEIMEDFAGRSDFVFFIDPPYTLAAKRLYNHWALDHATLFETASRLSGDFLMTYDNDEQIRSLAAEHDFDTREIAMKNTHHAKMTELLIGRDLSWAD